MRYIIAPPHRPIDWERVDWSVARHYNERRSEVAFRTYRCLPQPSSPTFCGVLSFMTTAASLIPSLRFKSWLSNGTPNAFGTLSTYAGGTVTPLATYTDSTASQQNL